MYHHMIKCRIQQYSGITNLYRGSKHSIVCQTIVAQPRNKIWGNGNRNIYNNNKNRYVPILYYQVYNNKNIIVINNS